MTNEEKANDICAKYGVSKLIPTEEECIAYNAAMEMAEWKDEQFKTKIEELFKALEKEGYNDRVKSGFEIFKDKLIEL